MVLEVGKDDIFGRHMTVLVKDGDIKLNDFFVAGTAFGRVKRMYQAGENFKKRLDHAIVGQCVSITGIWKHRGEGNLTPNAIGVAPDDLFYCLPKVRAWRIVEYRRSIEQLAACQVSGPPLEFAWEAESPLVNFRWGIFLEVIT